MVVAVVQDRPFQLRFDIVPISHSIFSSSSRHKKGLLRPPGHMSTPLLWGFEGE